MALKDRINIDQSGMTTDKKTALLKGVAHYFDIKNEDGTLDISKPSEINDKLKEKFAAILISWAKTAQDYERDLAANDIDITEG